jgi:thioredoxin-like negative regulator of GroEL
MSSWRKLVALAVLLVLAGAETAYSKPAPPDEVHWYTTLDEATTAAKESGRPMLVDFWADWCAACKVMDREAYSEPAFAEAARGFVAVRLNYDKKTALARKYNVDALPTLLFTDSYGGELFRHTGYLDGRLLKELLHSLPSDVSEYNRLDQTLLQNKNDFEALKGMASTLRAAGLFLTSNDYYSRAFDTKEAKAAPAERQTILGAMGANSLELKDGKQATDTFEKCLKESPKGTESLGCALGLGNAYALTNKRDKARTILEGLVRDHPGTPESQKAQALLKSL